MKKYAAEQISSKAKGQNVYLLARLNIFSFDNALSNKYDIVYTYKSGYVRLSLLFVEKRKLPKYFAAKEQHKIPRG